MSHSEQLREWLAKLESEAKERGQQAAGQDDPFADRGVREKIGKLIAKAQLHSSGRIRSD